MNDERAKFLIGSFVLNRVVLHRLICNPSLFGLKESPALRLAIRCLGTVLFTSFASYCEVFKSSKGAFDNVDKELRTKEADFLFLDYGQKGQLGPWKKSVGLWLVLGGYAGKAYV